MAVGSHVAKLSTIVTSIPSDIHTTRVVSNDLHNKTRAESTATLTCMYITSDASCFCSKICSTSRTSVLSKKRQKSITSRFCSKIFQLHVSTSRAASVCTSLLTLQQLQLHFTAVLSNKARQKSITSEASAHLTRRKEFRRSEIM